MSDIKDLIKQKAEDYSSKLGEKISSRVEEMKLDDNSHYFIYRVLGIDEVEGEKIDVYQNKGRFLYKYAGSFLEEITSLCFIDKYPNVKTKVRIKNQTGKKPKTFEIDCLVNDSLAYEIKWRDATTDGDHITKEHTRADNVKLAGYKPIRIMYYYPNREQAIKIQRAIKSMYIGLGGECYFGDEAWEYVKINTDIDLKKILEEIILEK